MPKAEIFKGILAYHAKDAKHWRKWLEQNHSTQKAVWLICYKKASDVHSLLWSDAVDEALCFGWIDSTRNTRDEESFYQYFAPRKPKSNWSRINKEKIERLQKAGKLKPAGEEMVRIAKENGSWTSLDEIEDLIVPDDLLAELKKHPKAEDYFEAFPQSIKKFLLHWVYSAKRPETRAKRITEVAEKASRNERANQWQKK